MVWEVEIIKFLQSGSNVFFDYVMIALTMLGDELVFMTVAMILYWCIDKRFAFKFMTVFMGVTVANTALKVLIRRERPFNKYPAQVKSIGEQSSGYSFPSGHTATITNEVVSLNLKFRRKLLLILSSITVAVVMFTRLYLGQHYLTDVLGSLLISAIITTGLYYLYDLLGDKEERIAYVLAPICIIVPIIFTIMGNFSENIFMLCGAVLAMSVGYYLEKRFVKYELREGVKFAVLRVAIGLVVALILKQGLKYIFPANLVWLSEFLRYFIIAIWALLFSNMLFKAIKI